MVLFGLTNCVLGVDDLNSAYDLLFRGGVQIVGKVLQHSGEGGYRNDSVQDSLVTENKALHFGIYVAFLSC